VYWLASLVAAALTGLAVGVVAAVGGIGGGVFMVPLFYFMNMDIRAAVGTSKLVIVFTSLSGASAYLSRRMVDVKTGLLVLASMMPLTYVGAYAVSLVDPRLLKLLVSAFIILYAARTLTKYFASRKSNGRGSAGRGTGGDRRLAVAIGVVSGIVSGLTGTGGGAVNVPLFTTLLGMDIHTAVATSTFTIFPSAVVAATRHLLNGDVMLEKAIPMAIGTLAGGQIGARLATRLSPRQLRLAVGLILIYAGARMLIASI